jgi:hypothetical protein
MKQKSKFCSKTTDVMLSDLLEMESNINLLVEQRQDSIKFEIGGRESI